MRETAVGSKAVHERKGRFSSNVHEVLSSLGITDIKIGLQQFGDDPHPRVFASAFSRRFSVRPNSETNLLATSYTTLSQSKHPSPGRRPRLYRRS